LPVLQDFTLLLEKGVALPFSDSLALLDLLDVLDRLWLVEALGLR
jgi:hypothetical protein